MSRRKRELTSDEEKLWRRVAGTVKPKRKLPQSQPAAVSPADAPAPASARPSRSIRVQAPAAPPPLADRAGEKRVRRGRLEIDATLDLHGHTQVSARTALERFLRAAQARGDRVVIVVTGAGRSGEGVLRRRLPEWLAERDLRPLTSGYAQAHRAHGGAGAFYVFIRRSRDSA